ncbi:MAG: type II toxin-antitoxin system VapC family toxin [Armatimonadetes bacterium]|nr:type II toxin-antitoxin system VapC family toxin [Armatimonadota bacterium]
MRRFRKPTLYLDTSVPNAYFDQVHQIPQKETVRFWNKVDAYRPHVSALVLTELLRAPDEDRRLAMIDLVAGIPKLPLTAEARELALLYVAEGIMPEESEDDAVHVALSTVHGIDFVVSWNFEHMVNVRVRRDLNLFNLKCGYRTIEIVSPPEL